MVTILLWTLGYIVKKALDGFPHKLFTPTAKCESLADDTYVTNVLVTVVCPQ